jgi:hypothetical protein
MTQTSVMLFLPLLLQVVHQVSPVVINFLSIVNNLILNAVIMPITGSPRRSGPDGFFN